jgi:hypothetical protein
VGKRSSDIAPAADDGDSGDTGDVVIYRYVDKDGRDVVTNELDSVPADARASLTVVESAPAIQAPSPMDDLGSFHLPSFVFGAMSMCLVVMVGLAFRRAKILLRVAAFVAVSAAIASAYFGWTMKVAGLGTGQTFESPMRAIDEANAAKAKAQDRRTVEDAIMREIDGR